MHVAIEPAKNEDLAALFALLERSGLPKDGLVEHLSTTLVARAGGSVVGSAALELYGSAALLRSVAVDPPLRGKGLGTLLTHAALTRARQHGVREIYLLTETAGEFFSRFGFQPIDRAEVPPAIQASVEFTSACPTTALVMALRLPHL
ncbi:MAG: arsenic resistance N-acetyltransferase ArsN2 [Armatimonadota bacterium]|nr:arsenic resistance N-acetyltransferase ArsN2 [Armatimonadota bacterium]